jgi:dGTPase
MVSREERFQPETFRTSDSRSPFQIDRDRILYSPHFARLAEVTQVRNLSGDVLVHNRLTHSLKVGQVARRIAEALLRNQAKLAQSLEIDADVAEAAGLAHDLGHPPFGHIAEEELDELIVPKWIREKEPNKEGYEGNAQSFRIVTALSVSDAMPSTIENNDFVAGLNLTRATLNAILKYPWKYKENTNKLNKWGSYQTEARIFDWVRQDTRPQVRSIEAEIMDWADDITYAIHDMIDFYCAGLIPLHLLANRKSGGDIARREWNTFFDKTCQHPHNGKIAANRSVYEQALTRALDYASIDGPYEGSQKQNRDLWRFSSELISQYIGNFSLNDSGSTIIAVSDREETDILKQLTWHYVIRRSDLATLQYGQKAMIKSLFDVYVDAIREEQLDLLPIGFAQLIQESQFQNIEPERWAADYISGLTERQVAELYRRIHGH